MRIDSLERHDKWRDETLQRILALEKLPESGDRFVAVRPSTIAFERAQYLLDSMEVVPFGLPAPLIFPTMDRGIRMEWRGEARELEFEILAEGQIEFLTIERGRPEREGTIDSNAVARGLITWLREQQ